MISKPYPVVLPPLVLSEKEVSEQRSHLYVPFSAHTNLAFSQIVVLDNFEEIGDLGIDDDSYILIITRGHLYDYNVLEWSLKTNAYYIGMIGSATKIEMSYDKLKKEGFTQKDIDRVHAPIGIKLAAKTPAEIAVSIAGQIINERDAKERSLK